MPAATDQQHDPTRGYAPVLRPVFVRTPVPAMELRKFWLHQFKRWAKKPGHRFKMLDGTWRDKLDVVIAIVGLLDNMRADGALRGPHGFWNIDQLAEYMGMSRAVAYSTLKTLEEMGVLVEVPVHDERGHRKTSQRSMRVPSE